MKQRRMSRMAQDPVCGMEVDESKAPAVSIYKGRTYHFCSRGCKVIFDKNPEQYLDEKGNPKPGSGMGMHH
jgi:Cu+-exporting ATPase